MSVITEGKNIGDLVRYQLDKDYCRDVVTIASGQNLKMGAVLGIDPTTGKYTATLSAGTTTDASVSGDLAITGSLSITGGTVAITGGTSSTTTEDSVETTTITGGTIAVTGGTVSIPEASLLVDDGDLVLDVNRVCAVAVLLEDCNATSADKRAVVLARAAIITREGLIFPVSATDAEKAKYEKDLARRGIIVRDSL